MRSLECLRFVSATLNSEQPTSLQRHGGMAISDCASPARGRAPGWFCAADTCAGTSGAPESE